MTHAVQLHPLVARREQLSDEISVMAAHLHSGTHHLLALIREFDEISGWACEGILSCAHWLSWKIGLSNCAALEQVRVAKALGRLPLIDDAFRRGTLSYSKVRAMTRVATPENEKMLVYMARITSGAQLERICRGYRRARDAEEGCHEDKENPERFLSRWRTSPGMVRIELVVHPDEAETIFQAVAAARDAWRGERSAAADDSDISAEAQPEPRDDLPEVSAEASIGSSDDDVQIEPPSDVSAETSRLSSVDALLLVAENFLETARRGDGLRTRRAADRYQLFLHLEKDARAENGRWHAELHDGSWICEDTFFRIACDAGIVPVLDGPNGAPLDVGRRTRSIPPAIRRALELRDRGCRFPGCTHRAYVEGHHIESWASGGETKLTNLVSLCHPHHTLVHEGGFSVETADDGEFIFRDPRGRVIEPVVTRLDVDGKGLETIVEAHHEAGLEMTRETALAWHYTPHFPYGDAVAVVLDPPTYPGAGEIL